MRLTQPERLNEHGQLRYCMHTRLFLPILLESRGHLLYPIRDFRRPCEAGVWTAQHHLVRKEKVTEINVLLAIPATARVLEPVHRIRRYEQQPQLRVTSAEEKRKKKGR